MTGESAIVAILATAVQDDFYSRSIRPDNVCIEDRSHLSKLLLEHLNTYLLARLRTA